MDLHPYMYLSCRSPHARHEVVRWQAARIDQYAVLSASGINIYTCNARRHVIQQYHSTIGTHHRDLASPPPMGESGMYSTAGIEDIHEQNQVNETITRRAGNRSGISGILRYDTFAELITSHYGHRNLSNARDFGKDFLDSVGSTSWPSEVSSSSRFASENLTPN
jgi:hypothetical protein